MEIYINQGARLGWLIDRDRRKVYVYRPGCLEECLDNPATPSYVRESGSPVTLVRGGKTTRRIYPQSKLLNFVTHLI